MNKRGVSLVELLGSIVIFSLVTLLVTSVMIIVNNASKRIDLEHRANQEGLVLIRTIESEFDQIRPTSYSTCGTNCFILTQSGNYEYQTGSQIVDWIDFAEDVTLRLEFIDQDLYINDVLYVLNGFTFSETSSLTLSAEGTQVFLSCSFELISPEGTTFEFVTTQPYNLLLPPA